MVVTVAVSSYALLKIPSCTWREQGRVLLR
jgi:hypothetical protein